MMYGLEDRDWQRLNNIFAQHTEVDAVVLYGSRSKGTYKPFSDVDITLMGHSISRHTLNNIALEIDDLLLPYQFDVSIYDNLRNEQLCDHINRRGITIYTAN